jgi:hypothetical protein
MPAHCFEMFISFFFKKPKVRKSVKIPANTNGQDSDEEIEYILDEGDVAEGDDSAAAEEAVIDAEENVEDDGQVAHDDAVVRSLKDVAIQEMAAKNIKMTTAEEREALKLFPAVIL